MKYLFRIALLSLLLAGCSFSFGKKEAGNELEPAPKTPTKTRVLPTATLTGTATPDFSSARIALVEYMPDDTLRVIIHPSVTLTGKFQAIVAEADFVCEVPLNDPDRMHCVGPHVPEGRQVIRVFRMGESVPLFQIEFMVPPRFTATPSPTPTITNTPTFTLAPAVPPSAIPLPTRSGPYSTPIPPPDPYPGPDTPIPPSPYP